MILTSVQRFMNTLISSRRANKYLDTFWCYGPLNIYQKVQWQIAISSGRVGRHYLCSQLKFYGFDEEAIFEALSELESADRIRLVDPLGKDSGFVMGYYEFV
jgi:hypothetical protein